MPSWTSPPPETFPLFKRKEIADQFSIRGKRLSNGCPVLNIQRYKFRQQQRNQTVLRLGREHSPLTSLTDPLLGRKKMLCI